MQNIRLFAIDYTKADIFKFDTRLRYVVLINNIQQMHGLAEDFSNLHKWPIDEYFLKVSVPNNIQAGLYKEIKLVDDVNSAYLYNNDDLV